MQVLCLCDTSKRAYSHSLLFSTLSYSKIHYFYYINLMCDVNDKKTKMFTNIEEKKIDEEKK